MARRRRRSRVFVDAKTPTDTPADAPADAAAAGADRMPAADGAPPFVITPVPATTTQPMRIAPPRPRPPTNSGRDA